MKKAGVPRHTCAVTLLENLKPYAIIIRHYREKSWGYVRADLIHEMCHVARPRANHGPVFQQEMVRLALAGAFKGVW